MNLNSSLPSLAAVSLLGVLFAGCQAVPTIPPGMPTSLRSSPPIGMTSVTPEQTLDAALLRPSDDVFRIGPGDKLEIEIMGDPSTRATTTIGPDGKVYYYILPGVDVWGLTLSEARAKLGQELQRFLRERPVVAISLREASSQRVWVLGRVSTPGVYTLAGPTTLLDAIAQGGGVSSGASASTSLAGAGGAGVAPAALGGGGPGLESADLSRAFVIRQGRMLPVDFQKLLREGDMSQNIYLQPDDFIFLPGARTSEVHVLGAVYRPQSQRMSGALTLAQAVAMSGGTMRDAYTGNVAILRGSLSQPQMAVIDLASIVRGGAPDVRLEPGDIVYVPYTPYRTLNRYANLILDSFARTVGVNAGAHAAGGDVSVGVNVSVGR